MSSFARLALSGCVAFVFALSAAPDAARSCPFCPTAAVTFSEQVAQSDCVVLVQWVKGEKPDGESIGYTVYEIKRIALNYKDTLRVGDRLRIPRYRAGEVGELFLLMGDKGVVIEWGSPLEITETGYNYIAQAPSPEAPTAKRLPYFLKFLEYSDTMIANDAFGEFANAPYKDVASLSDRLPREKIRRWVADPETPATRLGLYGLLLGLSGQQEDARLLRGIILEETEDLRLGVDGMIAGYLLLTGRKGLAVIDETKLRDADIPFSETYAAMQALRFIWRYAEGRIEKERLRESMRILLVRPELADLVIADLSRWKDWSQQDRLMKMFDDPDFNVPAVKRAIVRFMLVSSKDIPGEAATGASAKLPPHVVKGQKYVEELRKKDPKTVAEAEKFFFLK